MDLVLIIPILVSFLITLFFIPFWIKKAKEIKLIGRNMHSVKHEEIPEAGGIAVIGGFILGLLLYIAVRTFILNTEIAALEIFVLITTILIIFFVGVIDDIFGWKIGLSKRTRIFFGIIAAIPLMVINAGTSEVYIPFMGMIDLGLIYPLILIPLGISGASTTYNFLAGYNGLEASQGILILSALSIVTWFTGNHWLSLVGLCMISSLFAFYLFNKYPAKILPGDSLTYPAGALIAIMAILGDMERIAVFFFIPYVIETGLKLRGKLKKESFAKVNKDGTLEVPYKKFYGLEHIAIQVLKKIKKSKKVYEKEVVFIINIFQVLIILLGFVLFRNAIFQF